MLDNVSQSSKALREWQLFWYKVWGGWREEGSSEAVEQAKLGQLPAETCWGICCIITPYRREKADWAHCKTEDTQGERQFQRPFSFTPFSDSALKGDQIRREVTSVQNLSSSFELSVILPVILSLE